MKDLLAQIPSPDAYFWYTITVLLAGALIWIIARFLNHLKDWMKASDKKHNELTLEILENKKNLALHNQILEQHSKSLERKDLETGKVMKLAEEMIAKLQFLNQR